MGGLLPESLSARSIFGEPLPAGHVVKPADVPIPAQIVSMSVILITLPILGACLTRRIERVQRWKSVPISAWLLLAIYVDSFLFLFGTALLQNLGVNTSLGICRAANLMCLTCYLSNKLLIYIFLVEKVWIVRGRLQRRRESKLYLVNCFGMLLPYAAVVVFVFISRFEYTNTEGKCIIGSARRAIFPLIVVDVIINIYLNILIIIPLRKLYSFRHGNGTMRTLALRTFIGSLGTLISSVINLVVLCALNGEPGWMCLTFCSTDILFCVVLLHWATSLDNRGGSQQCSHPSHQSTAPGVFLPQLPDASLQKRRNMFTCCEEDFPEGCLKHHPWGGEGAAVAGSPPPPPATTTTPTISLNSRSLHSVVETKPSDAKIGSDKDNTQLVIERSDSAMPLPTVAALRLRPNEDV